jgi:Fe-S-cluster-containing hydrogenase component 2
MLVHDTFGMMISYRGALAFDQKINLPTGNSASPCNTCATKPCLTACPVNAITSENGYNVATCHAHLNTKAGETCMTQACRIRTSCPVSIAVTRETAHNLLHMRAFKGET